MNAVAIGAHRYVRIVFLDQGAAVDAGGVFLENLGVAMPAGLGDLGARFSGRLNVVGAVAVRTDWSIQVAFQGHLVVYAIEGLCILIRVAFPTGLVVSA
jgi:hypothetical protein